MKSTLACLLGITLALASLTSTSSPLHPDCTRSDPARFAEQFFQSHRSFYLQETPALKPQVTIGLYRALRNHYQCAEAEGVCHLDYDPWLGAQNGEMAEPALFQVPRGDARPVRVSMTYRFMLEPGKPARARKVVLQLQPAQPPQCWQVDDLITPRGHSLARRYSSKTP